MSLQVAPNRTGVDLTSLVTALVNQILEALQNPPNQIVTQGNNEGGVVDNQADAWLVNLTDGKNFATLKQGVPGVQDPALVVALSPNTPFPIPPSTVNAIIQNAVQQIADQNAFLKLTEALSQIQKELRIIRTALTSMAVENNRVSESDLDPNNPDFEVIN